MREEEGLNASLKGTSAHHSPEVGAAPKLPFQSLIMSSCHQFSHVTTFM